MARSAKRRAAGGVLSHRGGHAHSSFKSMKANDLFNAIHAHLSSGPLEYLFSVNQRGVEGPAQVSLLSSSSEERVRVRSRGCHYLVWWSNRKSIPHLDPLPFQKGVANRTSQMLNRYPSRGERVGRGFCNALAGSRRSKFIYSQNSKYMKHENQNHRPNCR
jgi:hypothetical protein